jgi:hypothetical protein
VSQVLNEPVDFLISIEEKADGAHYIFDFKFQSSGLQYAYASGIMTDYELQKDSGIPTITALAPGANNAHKVTFSKIYASGEGFPNNGSPVDIVGENSKTLSRPNIGTTGDPFGVIYDCKATNAYGSDTTNEVTTIEA